MQAAAGQLSRQGHWITILASGVSLPDMRNGRVWRHERRTVRGHPRSPHFSMVIISVTVQLCIYPMEGAFLSCPWPRKFSY